MDIRELIRLYYTDRTAFGNKAGDWYGAGYKSTKNDLNEAVVRAATAAGFDQNDLNNNITDADIDKIVSSWDSLNKSGSEYHSVPLADIASLGGATATQATTQQTANGLPQIQQNVTQSVAQLADPKDYIQAFLENSLLAIHPDSNPEEVMTANMKLKEIEGLLTKDQYAQMKASLLPYLEQQGVIDEEAITNLKKEELSAKVKSIVPAIVVDAMKGVGAVAQIYGGLQRLSEITMPTPPEAPQPSPELQDALRLAQRDTQQIDPRLQEARKRAALQTLMQGREAAVTGSAGQAGAFAANMQQQLINVNQEMQQAAIQDEQLRRQGMQTYGQLLSQKQAEDQFRKQYEMGVFDRNFREAAAQRTGAESLAATGISNLQALGSNIATNIALAQYYKDLRSQLEPQQTSLQSTAALERIRQTRGSMQALTPQQGTIPTTPVTPEMLLNRPIQPMTQPIGLQPQQLYIPTNPSLTGFSLNNTNPLGF